MHPVIAAAIERAIDRVHIRCGAGGYGAGGTGASGAAGDGSAGVERADGVAEATFGTSTEAGRLGMMGQRQRMVA